VALKDDLAHVSVNQLQVLTGRSYRFVKKKLADAKIPAARRDGTTIYYEAPAALGAIYAVGDLDAGKEAALLNRAKRELHELELAEKRGKLAPPDDYEAAAAAVAIAVRTRLLKVPALLQHELAEAKKPAEAYEIVEEAIHEALRELSTSTVETE